MSRGRFYSPSMQQILLWGLFCLSYSIEVWLHPMLLSYERRMKLGKGDAEYNTLIFEENYAGYRKVLESSAVPEHGISSVPLNECRSAVHGTAAK